MGKKPASSIDTPKENLVVIGVISLILSLILTFGNESHPLAVLIYWWPFYITGWVVGTKKGRKHMSEIWEESQKKNDQQQIEIGGTTEPTKICPECGWENPKGNDYCHDCGYNLNE